jgi:hypothetical protein
MWEKTIKEINKFSEAVFTERQIKEKLDILKAI